MQKGKKYAEYPLNEFLEKLTLEMKNLRVSAYHAS